MAKKGDIKHVNYMYRWRRAKKVLVSIGADQCSCYRQTDQNEYYEVYDMDRGGCPSCRARSFLENYRYNEKK